MSREIRFRCWNNCLRKYIPEDELMDSFGECLKEKHLYIEQYTGLTDKNGKEIYEGDLIKEGYRDDDLPMVVYFGEMEDTDDSLSYLGWACGRGRSLWDYDKTCKIVGNIHQNPELLGGEE